MIAVRMGCFDLGREFSRFAVRIPNRTPRTSELQVRYPGGRLTVAHGMSLAALHRHYAGRAEHVSHEMLRPEALAQLLCPWFEVDVQLADDEKYIISGVRVERR